ncbi:MFS transporter (plasmid) [Azospirillum humicireducens]|uniref:MFS transporter n=1 Tax=Azospirillum humicireducens TaxID=1226968 RepID=A0A2R4VTX3_9PROT|nr:MFS transporter [Azospirillum humicireducens]AWB07877.1 MFS transporter [Azospirillum humicireducens]
MSNPPNSSNFSDSGVPQDGAQSADSPLSTAAITLFGIVGPYSFLVSPVVAGQMAGQLDWSAGTIGLIMGCELAGASLVSFPAMRLLRVLSPRTVALLATVLFILANVASALVTSVELFLPARIVAGAAGGILSVVALVSAARAANPPKAFAYWSGGQTVAAAIGLLYLPDLFVSTGIGGIYACLAAAALLSLVVIAGFGGGLLPSLSGGGERHNLKAARWTLVAIFGFYVAVGGAWAFVGIPGAELGFTDAGIGMLSSLAMTAGILGSVLASHVGGKAHHNRFVLGSYLLLVLCLGVIELVSDHMVFAGVIVLLQVLWSFLLPLLLASLADSDDDGNMVILSNMIIGGGAALGPMLAGYTIDFLGGYGAVATEGGIILLLSAAAFARARSKALAKAAAIQAPTSSLSHG